jgi:hypothetical protein
MLNVLDKVWGIVVELDIWMQISYGPSERFQKLVRRETNGSYL